jgi:hypothetical protein
MWVKLANIIDADMMLELFTRLATFLKKIRTEPYLFQMSLMRILSENLFYRHFSLRWFMNPHPDKTNTPSSQQSNPSKMIRKPISEFAKLLSSEIWFNIAIRFFPILLINLQSFFLLVLTLTIKIAFLHAAWFFTRNLLFFTIK